MPPAGQPPSTKQASAFQTRTATDGELVPDQQPTESSPLLQDSRSRAFDASDAPNPYDPATNDTVPHPRRHSFTKKLFHLHDETNGFEAPSHIHKRSASGHRKSRAAYDTEEPALIPRAHNGSERRKGSAETPTSKPGLGPRPVGGHHKLGTFSGVFVPTCLNVLSILMFLRFGFILGQGGVLGIMGSSRAR
jgi:solute carrier family 12 (potassium/chloride transporters), member 9